MKERTKALLKKEVTIFERSVPVFLIMIVALAGVGAGATLLAYGTVEGEATVTQSLVIDETEAPTTDGPTIDTTYTGNTIVAGGQVTSHHTIQNNADQTVDTIITNSVSGPSDTTGVEATSVIYSQLQETQEENDGVYSIKVEKRDEPLSSTGQYSVGVTSQGETTQDYAVVWYGVPSGTNPVTDYTLKYEAEEGANNNPSVDDELLLVTDDGSQYIIAMTADSVSGGTVTFDLESSTTTFSGQTLGEIGDVVAIGLGYGDASAPFETDGGNPVNVTVDGTRLELDTDSSTVTVLDERTSLPMSFVQTGSFSGTEDAFESGYQFSFDTRYGLLQVGEFDVALVPDTYTLSTEVAPQ